MVEKKPEQKIMPSITAIVSGDPKTGKTHLACTFPAPVKIYSFERGAKFVASKFNKQIDIYEFNLPIIESLEPEPYAQNIWREFNKEYKQDVESGKYNTLVIDTGTHLWRLIRQAVTEEEHVKRLMQRQYEKPNLMMASIYDRAQNAGINLVVTHYLGAKFVNGDNTGESELKGWNEAEGRGDIVIRTNTQEKAGKVSVVSNIVKNRFDLSMFNQSFTSLNYDDLMIALGL